MDVGAGSLTVAGIDFTNGSTGVGHQVTISSGTATVSGNITATGTTSSKIISVSYTHLTLPTKRIV